MEGEWVIEGWDGGGGGGEGRKNGNNEILLKDRRSL